MSRNNAIKYRTDRSVPRHTIDLSLKPRYRYKAIAAEYKAQIQPLTQLFNSLLTDLLIPQALHGTIGFAARVALRKLRSRVETEEIRGISEVTGVPMYLLVSFNVILDLLMGCTSGGVRTFGDQDGGTKMLHFRTLDWGMDPLRSVVVQLDFIRSKSAKPREVLASSVTYVGFVGVLTGVRPNLSASLNFRAVHNARNVSERVRFRLHHVLVLLGIKQSISSLLRDLIIPEHGDGDDSFTPRSLSWIKSEIPKRHSTAAYLIFSDGHSAVTIEKDFDSGVVQESSSFIVLTNHDLAEAVVADQDKSTSNAEPTRKAVKLAAMKGFLEESEDRRSCIARKWNSRVKSRLGCQQERFENASFGSLQRSSSVNEEGPRPMRGRTSTSAAQAWRRAEETHAIKNTDIVRWVSAWPTTNEATHYSVILDPTAGKVFWVQRYLESVKEPRGQARRTEFQP